MLIYYKRDFRVVDTAVDQQTPFRTEILTPWKVQRRTTGLWLTQIPPRRNLSHPELSLLIESNLHSNASGMGNKRPRSLDSVEDIPKSHSTFRAFPWNGLGPPLQRHHFLPD